MKEIKSRIDEIKAKLKEANIPDAMIKELLPAEGEAAAAPGAAPAEAAAAPGAAPAEEAEAAPAEEKKEEPKEVLKK